MLGQVTECGCLSTIDPVWCCCGQGGSTFLYTRELNIPLFYVSIDLSVLKPTTGPLGSLSHTTFSNTYPFMNDKNRGGGDDVQCL